MGMLRDIGQAFRVYARDPGLACVVVLTLALGIGATTAVFSIVDAVLLHPVAGAESQRLVAIYEHDRNERRDRNPVAPANLADFEARSRFIETFAPLIYFAGEGVRFGSTEPQRVESALVSTELLELLGARATCGRLLKAEDSRGASVVISAGLWQSAFASDPGVVGRTVTIDGQNRVIVGVLAPGLGYLRGVDVWMPMPPREAIAGIRSNHFLTVIGRLRPGVTVRQATDDLASIARELEREHPSTNSNRGVTVMPLAEAIVGNVRPTLVGMLCAVALVLLIACGNLANLLLSRIVVRAREMAVRSALGATRGRLVRQVLTELLVLAAAGGIAGLLVSTWAADLLVRFAGGRVPQLEDGVRFDGTVILFCIVVSVATLAVFGLVPALKAGGARLSQLLPSPRRGGASGSRRLGNIVVAVQVSVSVVVLAGAGLLLHSLRQVATTDPGLATANRVIFRISLTGSRYGGAVAKVRFIDDLVAAVQRLPGVVSVGMASSLPVRDDGLRTRNLFVEGRESSHSGTPPEVGYRIASPGFFVAAGISLRSGRLFAESDTDDGADVAVVNETAARRLWPNEDPIGRRVSFDRSRWYRVVGVSGDVRYGGLESPPPPEIFVPHAQADYERADQDMTFVVHSRTPLAGIATSLRRAAKAVDSQQAVYGLTTMTDVVEESTAGRRVSTALLGVLAAFGFVLAIFGVYAITSYAVARRTREIAIRMALGANRLDVLRGCVLSSIRSTAAGLAAGLLAAPLVARLFSSLLYRTNPLHPEIYILISVLVCAAAFAASYAPASRATRIDPLVALRQE